MTDEPVRPTITQRGVVVTPDEYVLVVQRASDGEWELPGGRLDKGEDAHAGLRRELREETALDPEIVTPVETLAWENGDGKDRFGVYYYCRELRQEVTLSEEHDDAAWRPKEAVGSRLSDPQRAAVKATLERHRAHTKAEP